MAPSRIVLPSTSPVERGGAARRLADFGLALGLAGIKWGDLPDDVATAVGTLEEELSEYPARVTALVASRNLNWTLLQSERRPPEARGRPSIELRAELTKHQAFIVSWRPILPDGHNEFRMKVSGTSLGGWRANHLVHIKGLRRLVPPWEGRDPAAEVTDAVAMSSHILLIVSALYHDVAAALRECCHVREASVPGLQVSRAGAVLDWRMAVAEVAEAAVAAPPGPEVSDREFLAGFRRAYGVPAKTVLEVLASGTGGTLNAIRKELARRGMTLRDTAELQWIIVRFERMFEMDEPLAGRSGQA